MKLRVSCTRSLFSVITAINIVNHLYVMEYLKCKVFVISDHRIPYRGFSVCNGVFHERVFCSLLPL